MGKWKAIGIVFVFALIFILLQTYVHWKMGNWVSLYRYLGMPSTQTGQLDNSVSINALHVIPDFKCRGNQ